MRNFRARRIILLLDRVLSEGLRTAPLLWFFRKSSKQVPLKTLESRGAETLPLERYRSLSLKERA